MTKFYSRISNWGKRLWLTIRATAKTDMVMDLEVGADVPIHTASEDRLKRGEFANHIAEVLSQLSLREGRVFAIRGEWGGGKSSLKNLVAEKLDAKHPERNWLDFNPWQWGDGDLIARALFEQIADRLGGEHSKGAKARAAALRRYGAILTGASSPIKAAGNSSHLLSTVLTNASLIAVASAIGFNLPTIAMLAGCLAIISILTSGVGRLMTYYGRDHSNDSLDKVRDRLEKKLRTRHFPLVVFVDDIDRLEQEQIRMLLRHVKANANLPNIVFVLLFQPSIVERALDQISNGKGRAFLEKIVQANFDLPAVPVSTVHKIFGEELAKLAQIHATEENGFIRHRWGNVLIASIQPWLRNLRDVHRLISSIAMHLPLHVDDDVLEVNLIDFILLEVLRVFEQDLYHMVLQERQLVLQEHRAQGLGRREPDKAAAQQLIEAASIDRRDIAKSVLKDLFPNLEWAYGGMTYADGYHASWVNTKRACTARYFRRYFELQTAPNEISERRFMAFLASTISEAELTAAVAEIKADGLLISLVERFDESVARLPAENAAVLLPEMFRIAQHFVDLSNLPFQSPWISAWRATSWYLKQIPEGDRAGLMTAALQQTKALSVTATLIGLNDPTEFGSKNSFDPTLAPETVEELKAQWLQLIRSTAEAELLEAPDLGTLLYRWKDFTGTFDEPKAFVHRVIETNAGFAIIASRLMNRGTRYSAGDHISTPYYSFDKGTMKDLIGIETANIKSQTINPSEFPEYQEALETLSKSLTEWSRDGAVFA